MLIIDIRSGQQFVGDRIEEIPGGRSLNDEQLLTYLGISKQDRSYQQHKRPAKHRRIVLKQPTTQKFLLIPLTEYHKVQT